MSRVLVALTAVGAVAAIEPVRWAPLGYSVEAGSICAALITCIAVRLWAAGQSRFRWTVTIPVLVITLIFSAGAVVALDANLGLGAVIGTGLAAVGEGIIRKSKGWADRWLGEETGELGEKEDA